MSTTETLTSRDYSVKGWTSPGMTLYRDDVGDVEIADHFASLVTKIRELFDLGPGWDSYGARRVQRDAVRARSGRGRTRWTGAALQRWLTVPECSTESVPRPAAHVGTGVSPAARPRAPFPLIPTVGRRSDCLRCR